MFEFVEEPLDEISPAVKAFAEFRDVHPIGHRLYVCLGTSFGQCFAYDLPSIFLHSKVESLVAVTPIVTVFLCSVERRFSVPATLDGIEIRYHRNFPLRSARALRATLFAETQNLVAPFALAVFRAYWTDSLDISDVAVLDSLGAAVGLDAGEIAAAAEDPIWKQRLAANTEEAAGEGIFGVPTVDAGGKLFFGNDRLKMLERYLG